MQKQDRNALIVVIAVVVGLVVFFSLNSETQTALSFGLGCCVGLISVIVSFLFSLGGGGGH